MKRLLLYFESMGNLQHGFKMLCKSVKITFFPLRFESCIHISCLYRWSMLSFKTNHIHIECRWCVKDISSSHGPWMQQLGLCCSASVELSVMIPHPHHLRLRPLTPKQGQKFELGKKNWNCEKKIWKCKKKTNLNLKSSFEFFFLVSHLFFFSFKTFFSCLNCFSGSNFFLNKIYGPNLAPY